MVDVWLRLGGWWLGQALVHPVSRAWRSFSPALLHFVSLPFLAGFCCLGFGFLPGWPGWPSWPAWQPGPLGPITRLARLLRLTRLARFARLVWLARLARVTWGRLWKKTLVERVLAISCAMLTIHYSSRLHRLSVFDPGLLEKNPWEDYW